MVLPTEPTPVRTRPATPLSHRWKSGSLSLKPKRAQCLRRFNLHSLKVFDCPRRCCYHCASSTAAALLERAKHSKPSMSTNLGTTPALMPSKACTCRAIVTMSQPAPQSSLGSVSWLSPQISKNSPQARAVRNPN